jgi:hypothetical protein
MSWILPLMKQGCRGGLVDPTAPKARFPVWVVSQAANILDPIFVSGTEFHLHVLLGDAFTATEAKPNTTIQKEKIDQQLHG